MRTRFIIWLSFIVVLFGIHGGRATPSQQNKSALPFALSSAQLDQKVQSVVPKIEDVPWMQVRWRHDINLARLESQRTRKPLLIWWTGGDSLGTC